MRPDSAVRAFGEHVLGVPQLPIHTDEPRDKGLRQSALSLWKRNGDRLLLEGVVRSSGHPRPCLPEAVSDLDDGGRLGEEKSGEKRL